MSLRSRPGHEEAAPLTPRLRVALALLVSIFGALYAPAAGFAFVWDDLDNIVDNPFYDVPWIDGLRATQHDHMDPALRRMAGVQPAHDSYRPVLYAVHRVERSLFGPNPVAFHTTGVLTGALAIVLVFALARRILASNEPALVVASIFALHPLQVEAVAYVSCRGDLLAAIFSLASLLAALRGAEGSTRDGGLRARLPWLALVGLSYVLALLSKEAYVGLPIALALLAWANGRLRAHRADFVAYGIALALYLGLRLSMARATSGAAGLEGALLLPGLWLQYVVTFLSPSDLSIVRPYAHSLQAPGFFVLAGLCFAAAIVTRRRLDVTTLALRRALVGAFFALVLIGPSAVVVHMMGVVADRYVYLPLVGFALALVCGATALVQQAPRTARIFRVITPLLLLVMGVITFTQIPVWKDAGTLYAHALEVEPRSGKAAYGLGLTFARVGDCERAQPLFERAVALEPGYHRAWNNLAVCALQQRDYARAITASQRALATPSASSYRALYNLAVAHMALGHEAEGCSALQRALAINPDYGKARELYGPVCATRP